VLFSKKEYSQKEIDMSGTRIQIVTKRLTLAMLKGGEYETHLNRIIDELECAGYEVCKPIQPLFLPVNVDSFEWFDAITTITYFTKPAKGRVQM
jgi:hypothetical protein